MSEEIRPAIYDPEHYLEDAQKEIAMLKAEWHAEIERSKLYAKGQDLVVQIKEAEIKQLKAEIERLKKQ